MIPSTGIPKRIGAIYNRRPTTPWSEAEIREYKKLAKVGCFDSSDDLDLIERYYKSERKKGNDGVHRRDLLRLLRYWNGELDRAREWNTRVKNKRGFTEKKEISFNGERGTATDEDFKNAHEIAKREIESLRAKLSPVPEVGKSTVAE